MGPKEYFWIIFHLINFWVWAFLANIWVIVFEPSPYLLPFVVLGALTTYTLTALVKGDH